MDADSAALIRRLRDAGLSEAAIKAAWPAWWSDAAAATQSGRAELRFSLARKLGLAPRPLLGERVEFVWNDQTRFKHLTIEEGNHRSALASFGLSIGRILVAATPNVDQRVADASALREAILATRDFVDLIGLISTCWAVGIPVIHLRVFPLASKGMHAMVVTVGDRYAILLSRDAEYPAPIAFTLAHELGHIALGHLEGAAALVDLDEDTAEIGGAEEEAANRYALTLLTSSPEPIIHTNTLLFTARGLANAALAVGLRNRIDPGTLALCVGFRLNKWPVAVKALKYIYREAKPVWREVNAIAEVQLEWDKLGHDTADFLRNVMRDQ